MHDRQNFQIAELTFIIDACATVIEARSTLKWTYPLAYYLDKDFPPDIANFFVDFWQKDLEQNCERLTGLIESDINYYLRKDSDKMKYYEFKTKCISTNDAVRGYINNLSEKLEEWQKTRTYGSTDIRSVKEEKRKKGGIKSLFGFKY